MRPVGKVVELWRYPVVGLRGESLKTTKILETGISGDRAYQLRDREGRILGPVPQSSAPYERSTLLLGASIDETVEGGALKIKFRDASVSANRTDLENKLEAAVGAPVKVEKSTILAARVKQGRAIHLISKESIQSLKKRYPAGDFDVRRFRPNLVVSLKGEAGDFPEEAWVGKKLKVGEAALKVEKPNERCVVTTLPQEELPSDPRILETITKANNRILGVMCSVQSEGEIEVGDPLLLG